MKAILRENQESTQNKGEDYNNQQVYYNKDTNY